MKSMVLLGGFSAFLGVALGAFGAHGLKSRVHPDLLAVWQTGVQYHLIHAVALLLVGILIKLLPDAGLLNASGWALLVGIVLFSGSLYAMVLSGIRGFGIITPLGGVAFLVGWGLLVAAVVKTPI